MNYSLVLLLPAIFTFNALVMSFLRIVATAMLRKKSLH